MRKTTVLVLLFVLCILRAPAPVQAGPAPYAEYVLELEGAMPPTGGHGQTLTLIVESVNGQWEPAVWGHARTHDDRANHFGRIVKHGTSDGRTQLRVQLVLADGRRAAASAERGIEYALEFAQCDGVVEGKWQARYEGKDVAGRIAGRMHVQAEPAGFTAPKPGEHPRLLIRKDGIAALKAKAATAFGKDLMKRLEAEDPLSRTRMAVGQAMLYTLTGDKAHAQKARELLEADYSSGKWVRTEVHYPYVPVHDGGSTVVEAAIAFDLIHDACDEPFRKAMYELLAHRARYLYFCPANGADSSNWSAIYRSGAGMAALSVLDVPNCDALGRPQPPVIRAIKPPGGFAPARSQPSAEPVPVEFKGGAVTSWLVGGPLFRTIGLDLLTPLGKAPYRPRAGMVIAQAASIVRGGKIVPVPNEGKSTFRAIAGPYDVKGLSGGVARILYLYTVLDVKTDGTYQLNCTTGRITDYRILLGDVEVRDNDLVRLEQGIYPLLVALEPGDNRRAHKIPYGCELKKLTDEQAATQLAAQQEQFKDELADWTLWSQLSPSGHANPMAAYWLGMARLLAGNYLRWTIGDLGFNMEGESYTQHSLRALLPLAHCYRNATGKPLIGGPNIGMILPGYTARTIFRDGSASFLGYSTGGAPLGVDKYARGFGLVGDDLKPGVLWAWNRTQALADAGKLKGPYKPVDFLDPMSAAFMLVNYPLEMKEQNPAAVMPRVAVDKQLGGYVFRNRWQDGNDICATMFLNLNCAGGSWSGYEAGDFRISGLGVDWAIRGRGNGVGGDQGNDTGGDFNKPFLGLPVASWDAPPTFFQAARDGSGVLSTNMDRVYFATKNARGAKPVTMEPGMCRGKPVAYDLGTRGVRAFAADYSGACGAPALFVVVDKIAGSPSPPIWQMATDPNLPVTVEGNAFTIKAPNGATLRGTVVAPAAAKIQTRKVTHGHEATYDVHHFPLKFDRTVIDVAGDGAFLVVMTLQNGPAPKIAIEGQGLGPAVKAGGQTIRFDGEKIILGSFGATGAAR